MGTVWEGLHVTLGTRVAVKFIDGTVAESPEALHRFENEARAAARLNSKYAVQVYDHGSTTDGRPFIVMEFLQGEPLDARLDREIRIHPLETARIIAQVCRALSRAHAAGIVHRDLKPENVFLVWDDEDQANVAKVVDFGIAKFTGNQLGVSSSTRTGSLLGTPYFMSPEQARGLRSVDFHTDLWSLGVIAFRCIVGKLPFEGVSVGDLLVKICTAPIAVPSQEWPDCPAGFDGWFARAMQREPSDRFSSAQELADELLAVCGGTRSSLASGILDRGTDPSLGVRTLGGGASLESVSGVTSAGSPDTTGDVFARTATSALATKTSTRVAIGVAAVIGIGVLSWMLIRRGGDERASIAGDPTATVVSLPPVDTAFANPVASALPPAAPGSESSASPSLLPSPTAVPSQTGTADGREVGRANPRPSPAVAQPKAAPPARGGPIAPANRGRPVDNRPIDVGY
jgi:serine/threonine-protein kinase